jgi:hypothetical protein
MLPGSLLESGFVFRHPDLAAACRWLVGADDRPTG